MIAAVSANGVIGKNNELPWDGCMPSDMAFFVQKTKGKPVVMGRSTFQSIGKPLPNRINVVLTRDIRFKADGVLIAHSTEEAIRMVEHHNEVMIIGGDNIYKQFLDIADKLYITHICTEIEDGDSFFPEINKEVWKKIESQNKTMDKNNKFDHEFATYERI